MNSLILNKKVSFVNKHFIREYNVYSRLSSISEEDSDSESEYESEDDHETLNNKNLLRNSTTNSTKVSESTKEFLQKKTLNFNRETLRQKFNAPTLQRDNLTDILAENIKRDQSNYNRLSLRFALKSDYRTATVISAKVKKAEKGLLRHVGRKSINEYIAKKKLETLAKKEGELENLLNGTVHHYSACFITFNFSFKRVFLILKPYFSWGIIFRNYLSPIIVLVPFIPVHWIPTINFNIFFSDLFILWSIQYIQPIFHAWKIYSKIKKYYNFIKNIIIWFDKYNDNIIFLISKFLEFINGIRFTLCLVILNKVTSFLILNSKVVYKNIVLNAVYVYLYLTEIGIISSLVIGVYYLGLIKKVFKDKSEYIDSGLHYKNIYPKLKYNYLRQRHIIINIIKVSFIRIIYYIVTFFLLVLAIILIINI
jgi:hypothetical protein